MHINDFIFQALRSLGVNGCSLSGHPTNETPFLSMYQEVTGVDSNNNPIMSSDKSDLAVTSARVSAKAKELEDAEPMRLLRLERDSLIAETDWWASSDLTMTDAQKKYRQDLRDITKSATSLDDVTWPTKPE